MDMTKEKLLTAVTVCGLPEISTNMWKGRGVPVQVESDIGRHEEVCGREGGQEQLADAGMMAEGLLSMTLCQG